MTAARSGHTAAFLPPTALAPMGTVLLAGGKDASNTALITAEIFDPVARAFQPAANLSGPRTGAAAVRSCRRARALMASKSCDW